MSQEGNNPSGGGTGGSGDPGAPGGVTIEQVQAELAKFKEEALNSRAMLDEATSKNAELVAALKKTSAEAKDFRLKLKEKGSGEPESEEIKAAVESVRKEFSEKLDSATNRNKTLLGHVKQTTIDNVIASEAAKLGVLSDRIDYVQTKLARFITLDEDTLTPTILREDGKGSAYKGGEKMTIAEMVKDFCLDKKNAFLLPSNPNAGSGGSPGRQQPGGYTRAMVAKMTPQEFVQHEAAIAAQIERDGGTLPP